METRSPGMPHAGDSHEHELLLSTIDAIVWQVDVPSFQFTFVSRQAERLLGYSVTDWFVPIALARKVREVLDRPADPRRGR